MEKKNTNSLKYINIINYVHSTYLVTNDQYYTVLSFIFFNPIPLDAVKKFSNVDILNCYNYNL